MWSREQIEKRLINQGLQGRTWGRRGHEVVQKLEAELKFSLDLDLALFAESIGNLMVDPFSIIVTGDTYGEMTCLTESKNIGLLDSSSRIKGIKIMDHAGESYIYIRGKSVVNVYDSMYLDSNNIIMQFNNLSQFIDWIIKEAKLIQE